MKLSKKFLLTGTLCVVLAAGALGGVAIANADDEDSAQPLQVERINIMDKVAEIYEQNTGTAIDSAELQKAFEEAGAAIRTEAQDAFLQKLVDEGKITQEQADEWKAWLEARPDVVSDEFKAWLESRPDIPELFGEGNRGGMMPFSFDRHEIRMGNGGMQFGFRDCLPETAE